ncbi:MAG: EAL domain-containing protein [Desulfobacterales bacterium]|nr:EAL domain-containing protein [Desulfobacterales bacterium]
MNLYSQPDRTTPLALVVDDDDSIRLTIAAALKKYELDVIESESGINALNRFQSDTPDIILMDALMPDLDGFAACEAIRSLPQGQFTQILMVTGLDDTESVRKAFEKGANGFVTKPINLTMLGQHVRYMLRAGRAFRELHASRNRLAKTQELAMIGNWQIDLKTGTFHCTPEAWQLLGIDAQAPQPDINTFLSPIVHEDREHVGQSIRLAAAQRSPLAIHYRIEIPGGRLKHISNKAEIIADETGRPAAMLGIVQDVTQLKKAEDEIRFLAFSDSLTGLANRLLFMDRLEQTILDAQRHQQYFALLFLDLDHFKHINDTLGHHVGDLLLKKVAETIQNSIRKSDSATRLSDMPDQHNSLIARLGGDEFTILLSQLDSPDYAAFVAQRLLEAIPETHTLDGHEVSISTSIGISIFPDDGDRPDLLLKRADTAMYDAKQKGRNGYQFFKKSMNEAAKERFAIDMDLKKALKNDEFRLVYQPQVNLKRREIVGVEALLRWDHPVRGLMRPDTFISIAEESSTIIDINHWVIETACRQAQTWRELGLRPLKVAVNLSGFKLSSQNLAQKFDTILEHYDLDPRLMELEMTENVLMQNTDLNIRTLKQLKKRSLRIALDDFGTGYSSLSYLTSFPVDVIKIDKSFVMDDSELTKNNVIIKAIVAMGHSLGKNVLAEGIETEEQYHLLREMGCDEGQGYYFSRPQRPSRITEILTEGRI